MRAYFLLGLAIFLTGCASEGGFSTGGLPPRMPPQLYNLYIETQEADSPLYQALRQDLRAQGVRIADLRGETKTILRIYREGVDRRTGASGSDRQLIYTATYVVTVDGKELFIPETLNTYRNYTATGGGSRDGNSGASTGRMTRAPQESAILDGLARDMSRQIMRKLTTLPQPR